LKIENVLYLPSGRIFLCRTDDNYLIECTEMRDVSVGGKQHSEVRNTSDPHIIWKHLVDYKDKWLLTVSTQKGCTHNCQFCDVANLPFKGNLSQEAIESQIEILINNTPYVNQSKKVKIGFARMGEPAHNLQNVLNAMKNLNNISFSLGKNYNWLPCFNSILPSKINSGTGYDVIDEVINVKENNYNGFLHFQISCNSTNEEQRKKLFGNADVLTIEEIINYTKSKRTTNRTITLNFIVMQGVEVDVNKLKKMGLSGDRFTVKLIPLNNTNNSQDHDLNTYANYNNYEDLQSLGEQFNSIGVPTVIDAIAKCEEAGLCCGQLAQIFQ
jgi:23S rRNA (adenine2503-C2)-methyltransferase